MQPIENRELRGVTARIVWAVVLSAVVTSGTVTGLYFKTDNRITRLEEKTEIDKEFKIEVKQEFKDVKSDIDNIHNRLVIIETSRK